MSGEHTLQHLQKQTLSLGWPSASPLTLILGCASLGLLSYMLNLKESLSPPCGGQNTVDHLTGRDIWPINDRCVIQDRSSKLNSSRISHTSEQAVGMILRMVVGNSLRIEGNLSFVELENWALHNTCFSHLLNSALAMCKSLGMAVFTAIQHLGKHKKKTNPQITTRAVRRWKRIRRWRSLFCHLVIRGGLPS